MQDSIEKNKLHELIHGLTKSDKAYIKKYSKLFNTDDDTIHKTYYTLLEKMEIYSSVELKRKLEKHGGVRRFKNAEQEIYSQILEDLVILKSKKRPTWQYYIEHMKLGYLFLDNKFDEAMKQFEVLEKIKDKEKNATIDYLYHKFYYFQVGAIQIARTSEEIEKVNAAEEALRKSLQDVQLEFLLEAANFNFESYRYNTYNKTRTQFVQEITPFKEKYVDVLPSTLKTDKYKMLSLFYHFFCNYYMRIADFEKFDSYSKMYYEEYKDEKVKSQFYLAYVNALYFRITYLVLVKDESVYLLLKEFGLYIEESLLFETRAVLHAMYCQTSLYTFLKFNDFASIKTFIKVENEAYQNEMKTATIRVALATDLQWAVGFFTLKRYAEAQTYLDKIFVALGKIKETSNNILISASLLDILIHFELKNYENINYYITNLEKEITRRNQLIQFDKDFFSHLRKLNHKLFAGQKPETESFIQFLQSNKDQDRVDSYLDGIDIENWLKSY